MSGSSKKRCCCEEPPEVEEACCLPDGSCIIATPIDCVQIHGGTVPGQATCVPDPCEEELQACCLPDGSCQDLTTAECKALEGSPQGPGTTCAGVQCNVCPPDCITCPQTLSVSHTGMRIETSGTTCMSEPLSCQFVRSDNFCLYGPAAGGGGCLPVDAQDICCFGFSGTLSLRLRLISLSCVGILHSWQAQARIDVISDPACSGGGPFVATFGINYVRPISPCPQGAYAFFDINCIQGQCASFVIEDPGAITIS